MSSNDVKIIESNDSNKNNSSDEVEFNRSNVESEKKIKLADSLDGLDLFCYIKCSEKDPDFIKRCRGVVFNDQQLIMNGFPYTYEFTENESAILKTKLNEDDFDKYLFYDAYEGSLIRMFNFKDKWYTTTNRKLDANKSKWSSKQSFGHFFEEALIEELKINEKLRASLPDNDSMVTIEKFQSILDKNKQYMFLLLNNDDNRIVCQPPSRPTFFHVGTFIDDVLNMDEDINLPYPTKHSFKNLNEIYEYVDSINIQKLQGVIVFTPDNMQYKIFSKDYYDYYRVRGNEPSVKFRYLQVRMDKRYNNLIHKLYPSFSSIFNEYENIIYQIAKIIHKAYFDRFIKNLYVKVPHEEYNVIKECHSWHLKDKSQNKINLNKVLEILNLQSPTNLNKMIRRFYISSKEQKSGEEHKDKDFDKDK